MHTLQDDNPAIYNVNTMINMLKGKPTLAIVIAELLDVDSKAFNSDEFQITQHQAPQWEQNDYIDLTDRNGKWRVAKVRVVAEAEEEYRWVQASTDYKNFVKLESISKRGPHWFLDEKVNDVTMVSPGNREHQWFKERFYKTDRKSAQILNQYVDGSKMKS